MNYRIYGEGEAGDDKNGPRCVVWASIVHIFFCFSFFVSFTNLLLNS